MEYQMKLPNIKHRLLEYKHRTSCAVIAVLVLIVHYSTAQALSNPGTVLKVFQFPSNMIPRIDGDPSDWDIVTEDYVYRTDLLIDTEEDDRVPRNTPADPGSIDVRVIVGWVNGMNQLYFLFEAYDDCWEFDSLERGQDLLEIIVDADLSGGDFVFRDFDIVKDKWSLVQKGTHAQNYHIYVPAVDRSWAMVWHCPSWINDLPYMNYACSYNFKSGESGNLVMECWITPFDYVSFDSPAYSSLSQLTENSIIGLSWVVSDSDRGKHSLLNLSHTILDVHNADYLRAFRLMPLEERFLDPIDAGFTFTIVDKDTRTVAFKDLSHGEVTSLKWEFGDGSTSSEQNPIHTYRVNENYGAYTVTLTVSGPAGTSRYSALMEVVFR